MRIEEGQGAGHGTAGQPNGHAPPVKSPPTAEQILGEIRDYCRQTHTAESTFGRLVVNDGKLVSRLRDGARITTGTLDKVRAYLSEHQRVSADAPTHSPSAKSPNGAAAIAPPGFRFFDNRQKYLLFVSTCSEKTEVGNRISLELGNLQPAPPALRIFDAGVGDGTVLSRVMRAVHARFPTMPLYVVAKEISYEDVRLMLIFRYRMHTLPDEVSGPIGTSTLFAAWNAAIYVAQIEDNRLSEVVRDGRYLEATDRVLKKHGGLWFNDETYVISRRRAPA